MHFGSQWNCKFIFQSLATIVRTSLCHGLTFIRYAEASIKTAAYNQIMGLSRDFHTEKQSGELYKSIEQGSSVTSLLETIMFQVVPMFVDIIVAFSYL